MKKLADLYELFEKRAQPKIANNNVWWQKVWQEGREAFALQRLPTTKSERYRYTPIASRLVPALSIQHDNVTIDVPTLWATDLPGYHVVVSSKGIQVPKLPIGVTIACITPSDILPQRVKDYVTKYAKPQSDPFIALNTRGFDKIYYIHVAEGINVGVPIYLHHVMDVEDQIEHPRFFLFFEAQSRATIVDVIYQGKAKPCFVNEVTERFLGAGARVMRALWQLVPTPDLYQFRYERNTLCEGAVLKDYTVSLGGGIVRNEQVVDLLGYSSSAFFHGAYLTKAHDYMENQLRMIHHAPHTESKTYYKGVALEEGIGVFHGKIDVKKQAHKTDASQYHHGWSFDNAQLYARPELDIEADDVVCKHGATLGKGIEEMLFYLRTRGIGMISATRWLLKGFLKDAMDDWGHDYLCGFVYQKLDELLADSLFLPSFVETSSQS